MPRFYYELAPDGTWYIHDRKAVHRFDGKAHMAVVPTADLANLICAVLNVRGE